MSSRAVDVIGLSKQFTLDHRERATTLGERVLNAVRHPLSDASSTETLWALKDLSFSVPVGEAVGIIGRNGAGKSTLLKILSRITPPTTGEVRLRGLVGSLLEVGTGFHPELTGRENIFLNGAILGMRRKEIAQRFDEIVAFAEVERFLDTPVKRYSSGMYVRLAFAVAAHLEPDILIVDEVLAVGDAEFQRKCLGKMGEVAGAGRTVLFVSHALQMISTLTTRVLLLDAGQMLFDGPTAEGLAAYRRMHQTDAGPRLTRPVTEGMNRLASAQVITSAADGVHHFGRPLQIEFEVDVREPAATLDFSVQLVNADDRPITHLWCFDETTAWRRERGRYRLTFYVSQTHLYAGRYTLTTFLTDRRTNTVFESLTSVCPFTVTMEGRPREDYDWGARDASHLESVRWVLESLDDPARSSQRGQFDV
jgi:lipopolysaccharide transport system ATP-binding protein